MPPAPDLSPEPILQPASVAALGDPAFKLLADPTRARILAFLLDPIQRCCSRDDGICGCDLETFLGVSQPTVSHHMKALVEAGLVTAEKRGRWVYYDLVPERFRALGDALLDVARHVDDAREPSPIQLGGLPQSAQGPAS